MNTDTLNFARSIKETPKKAEISSCLFLPLKHYGVGVGVIAGGVTEPFKL